MYHRYFGLNESPFSIAVDPRYLFMSARHQDALAHLLYGVGVGGGFILLTGEVGTGKTTINRCVLEQLPEHTDIALILNPALNAVELLASVCDELNIEYQPGEQSLKALTDKLHQFLLSNHANGRNTVLLIDEAQHLQLDVLEQIRLLTNLETHNKKLLQIILVGQPELQTLLGRRELRQLSQRITARYQLKPLNRDETEAYINHRLQVAGLPENQRLFPPGVISGIHKISGGVPRLINLLCDRMLLGTYGQGKSVVDKAMMKQAAKEVLGEEEGSQSASLPWPMLLGVALIAVAAVGLWWLPSFLTARPDPAAQLSASPPAPITAAPVASEVATVAEQATDTLEQFWYSHEQQALDELLSAIAVTNTDADSQAAPCARIIDQGFACREQTAASWSELQSFNRPAVLQLISRAKMEKYTVLLGLSDEQAFISFNGAVQSVPLQQLGQHWTGAFRFIWQPGAYTAPVALGTSGPVVDWLASRFAQLDQQPTPLADTTFNRALSERVKIFQRNNQLVDDGVVGLKTLLKLNEQLGVAKTLQQYQLQKNQPQTSSQVTLEQPTQALQTGEG